LRATGYPLGTYGVDPSTKTAWAVVNYSNAQFVGARRSPGGRGSGDADERRCVPLSDRARSPLEDQFVEVFAVAGLERLALDDAERPRPVGRLSARKNATSGIVLSDRACAKS
jgi:hypothetical protein